MDTHSATHDSEQQRAQWNGNATSLTKSWSDFDLRRWWQKTCRETEGKSGKSQAIPSQDAHSASFTQVLMKLIVPTCNIPEVHISKISVFYFSKKNYEFIISKYY